ncbi:hypothetical protein ACFLZ7_01235 [Nanoarchaeota archaeon]
MNKNFLIGICMILILAVPAFALTTSYETAAVGRLVGDTPQELINQLQSSNIDLQHATYFGDGDVFNLFSDDKVDVLNEEFGSSKYIDKFSWNLNDVTNSLNNFQTNEFLIVEEEGEVVGNTIKAGGLSPSTASSWVSTFQTKNPLVVFDSHYSGLYLPKNLDSFIKEIGQDSVIIAPTAYPSREFVKSFICNVGRSSTVGEAFKRARNNYYWAHMDVDNIFRDDEFVGLALLSYTLYGVPTLNVDVPYYSKADIDDFCEDFLKNYDATPVSTTSSMSAQPMALITVPAEPRPYKKYYEFEDTYYITTQDGFNLVTSQNTVQEFGFRDLVLPTTIKASRFPLKTVITNVSLVGLDNYADITANIPEWNNSFIARGCNSTTNPGIEYAHSFTEDQEAVLVKVNPIEILDCQNGLLRVYGKVRYAIDYIPYSNVMIQELTYDDQTNPGNEVLIDILLENIGTSSSGNLRITKSDGTVLRSTSISLNPGQIATRSLTFNAPNQNGVQDLYVEYVESNDLKTKSSFTLRIGNNGDLCVPDYTCDDWFPGTCPGFVNGVPTNKQKRTCSDQNECTGSESYDEMRDCPEQQCQSDIVCENWGPTCNTFQNGIPITNQARTCKDLNECISDYTETKECPEQVCEPNIVCDNWGPETCPVFMNGILIDKQGRTCRDLNGCTEEYTETKECPSQICEPKIECSTWGPSECPVFMNGILIDKQGRTCTDTACGTTTYIETKSC